SGAEGLANRETISYKTMRPSRRGRMANSLMMLVCGVSLRGANIINNLIDTGPWLSNGCPISLGSHRVLARMLLNRRPLRWTNWKRSADRRKNDAPLRATMDGQADSRRL